MRSLLVGLSCFSLLAAVACSDSSDDPAATVGGSSGAGGSADTAGGAGAAGGADAAAPAGGSGAGGNSNGNGGSDGSSSELGVGGALELEPSAGGSNGNGSGDGAAAGGAAADAGSPPAPAAVCPPGPFPANPLDGAAAPQVVCSGLTFAEGTVWFAELNTLFFSDFQLNNPAINHDGRIMRFSPGGECEEFIPNAGTNGLVIAPDGKNLLTARHVDRTLTLFDVDTREPTVFLADNAGEPFNSPNDIAIRSDGNIYFTDPNYLAAGRPTNLPTRAYRIDTSGALSVIDETGNPNGITLSPDESRLYLSHLGGGNNIIVFDVDATGAVSNPQPFANVGSDGMGIDCAGNLYTTGSGAGVQVFSPDGQQIGTIPAPGSANVAFGGPDRRTLFIAATNNVLSVELAIPGLPY